MVLYCDDVDDDDDVHDDATMTMVMAMAAMLMADADVIACGALACCAAADRPTHNHTVLSAVLLLRHCPPCVSSCSPCALNHAVASSLTSPSCAMSCLYSSPSSSSTSDELWCHWFCYFDGNLSFGSSSFRPSTISPLVACHIS